MSETTTATRTLLDKSDDFCNRVLRACTTIPVRAQIRSALGRAPDDATSAHLAMARLIPTGTSSEREVIYYGIAGMLAAYDRYPSFTPSGGRRNIGATIAELAERNLLSGNTARKRIEIFTRCSPERLIAEYRRIAYMATRQRVYCDWGVWLRDALLWPSRRPEIAKQWAYSYARLNPMTETDPETAAS